VAGALSETELEAAIVSAGFQAFRITWRKDVFAGSALGGPAQRLGTLGINFDARKPG
jgi:hypothetical protein